MELSRLMIQQARQAFAAGQYRTVATLLSENFELCQRFPGDYNLGIMADVLHMRALLHMKLLREAPARTPQEALTLAKSSLDIRRDLYGSKDQRVAASYGIMAILEIACEKTKEALGFLDQCMAIRLLQPKEQAANISYTHLYYGWCYIMMEQYLAANEALAEALTILTHTFDETRVTKEPLYMWILTAQAYVYRKMGIKDRAREADREVFRASVAVYGLPSPRTLVSWYKSAWWHWEDGSLQSALRSTVDLVGMMKKVKFYGGHMARALNLLSKIQEELGEKDISRATMASALYLCDFIKDEQWNRELRIFWTLEGPPSWAKRERDRKFDELVFFHDR